MSRLIFYCFIFIALSIIVPLFNIPSLFAQNIQNDLEKETTSKYLYVAVPDIQDYLDNVYPSSGEVIAVKTKKVILLL